MNHLRLIEKRLLNPYFALGFLVFLALIASILVIISDEKSFATGSILTRYNNFVIFSQSFYHLLDGKDLYIAYANEYWDLYKYSPAFSLFFGIFAVFPPIIGLSLWNILNAVVLGFAIISIPKFQKTKLSLVVYIVAIEALTSFQNQQSNALMAGLIVGAYVLMERKQLFWAVGLLMASVFIKLFGIVAFLLFLFYPNKFKTFWFSVFWLVFFAFIPLVATDYLTLIQQYKSWALMLANDHSVSFGFSVMGWLNSWFGLSEGKNLVLLVGLVGLLIPLVRWKLWTNINYRMGILSSILIWVVIFNHKAESPTFIIAMSGAAIWYIIAKKNKFNLALIFLAIVFTSLSPSDLFPQNIRNQYFIPYVVKAIPMILIWIKINMDILLLKKDDEDLSMEILKS